MSGVRQNDCAEAVKVRLARLGGEHLRTWSGLDGSGWEHWSLGGVPVLLQGLPDGTAEVWTPILESGRMVDYFQELERIAARRAA